MGEGSRFFLNLSSPGQGEIRETKQAVEDDLSNRLLGRDAAMHAKVK